MAADSARRVIKNAPYRIYWMVLSNTTFEPISGGLTAASVSRSIDGAAFSACTDTPHELGTTGTGYTELTATEMAADNIMFMADSTDAAAIAYYEELHPEAASDSGVAQGGASSSITLRAAASATNDYYNGQRVEIVRGTGAGQERCITDYVGSTQVATVDRAWATNPDNTSVYVIHATGQNFDSSIVAKADVTRINDNATAASNLESLYVGGLTAGSVNDTGATTTIFKGNSGLSSSDDFYQYAWLIFTSGANAGLAERISSYTGATRSFTMEQPFPNAPANSDNFVILGKAR